MYKLFNNITKVLLVLCSLSFAGFVFSQTCLTNFSKTADSGKFSIAAGTTVAIHQSNGLKWNRCLQGETLMASGLGCNGTAVVVDWLSAVGGVPAGKRLPNAKELMTIIERACHTPSLDTGVFLSVTSTDRIWTSTAIQNTVASNYGAATASFALNVATGEIEARTRTSIAKVLLLDE